jgi:hypothetical protein
MANYAIIRPSDNKIISRVVWDGTTPCDFESVFGAGVTTQLDEVGCTIGGWYEDGVGFHLPMPKITGIDPASGAAAGGTSVTLTGENFRRKLPTIKFDGTDATNVVVVSDTSLTCDTPAHAVGQVNVVASNEDGNWTGQDTLTNGFEYTA